MLRNCHPFDIPKIAIGLCLTLVLLLPAPAGAQLRTFDDVDVEFARTTVDEDGVMATAMFGNLANRDVVIFGAYP